MLKVYGRNNSVNVMKVMWLAAELGLEVERIDVGGPFGGTDDPEFRRKSPNGTIPMIEDGAFHMFESNAIVRYLAEVYGGAPWHPADVRERATAGQWMDFASTMIGAPMTPIFWQLVRTPEAKRDKAAVDDACRKAARLWAVLDGALRDRSYLLGRQPSMADIPAACHAHRWFALPLDRPDLPHLRAWYDRLAERQAYRDHVMLPMT